MKRGEKVGTNSNHLHPLYHSTMPINITDIIRNDTIYDETRLDESFDINKRPFRSATMGRADSHVAMTSSNFEHRGAITFNFATNSILKEQFSPAEMMNSQLSKDANEWKQEYADVPSVINVGPSASSTVVVDDHVQMPKVYGEINTTHFSGFLFNQRPTNDTISIGQYFSKNSPNLSDVVSQKNSPPHAPINLIANIISESGNAESTSGALASFHISPVPNQVSRSQQDSSENDYASQTILSRSMGRRALANVSNSNRSRIPRLKTPSKWTNNLTNGEITHSYGKFPLKANLSEIVWPCIKLEKTSNRSVAIQNTSDKKLSLKVLVIGPGFHLSSGMDSLVLQGNECRAVGIAFCPKNVGKAIGKVIFKPALSWPDGSERSIHLIAYGGNALLRFQGIEVGPNGCSFLKIGETSNITSCTLKRKFTIYNNGSLNGVALMSIKIEPNLSTNQYPITIEPNKCIIHPNSSTNVSISYNIRDVDLDKLREKNCNVITVAILKLISGTEMNLPRVASMLPRNGPTSTKFEHLTSLVNEIPVGHLEKFCYNSQHVHYPQHVDAVFDSFKTAEIALTFNRTYWDETLDSDPSVFSESTLYRTAMESQRK